MPDAIVKAAHQRELVIFAGAGISTETSNVFPDSIYDLVVSELKPNSVDKEASFPEVMQAFQEQFGRAELVRIVKKKFDYIDSFDTLRYDARLFHRELATMPYIDQIVTTNWDTYFEEECGATPFVSGEDIAFHGLPGRKVLKIHGSMTNLGSLVATEEDYQKRLESLGSDVMGGLLRNTLATKTVVFIGYSLRDWNFRRLYEALRADAGAFAPRAYVVSPYATAERNEYDMEVISTSGRYFLASLKEHLYGHCFISDDAYELIAEAHYELNEVAEVAKSVSIKESPTVIFSWFYHDGLRDVLRRMLRLRTTGEYSDRHRVQRLAHYYIDASEEALSEGRYGNHAYLEGYANGLMLMLDDGEVLDEEGEAPMATALDLIPWYFVYGSDSEMRTEEEFREALRLSRRRAPKARAWARERTKDIPDGMVTSHPPFLPNLPNEGRA